MHQIYTVIIYYYNQVVIQKENRIAQKLALQCYTGDIFTKTPPAIMTDISIIAAISWLPTLISQLSP